MYDVKTEFILLIFWEESYSPLCAINISYINFWSYVVLFDKNETNAIYVVKNIGTDNSNLNEFSLSKMKNLDAW